MKAPFKFFVFLLFLLSLGGIHAQPGYSGLAVPLKSLSPLFGKDIIMHDSSVQNQRNIAICSAFNGWLYAVYCYNRGLIPYITFLRSIDNGITWSVLGDYEQNTQNWVTTKLDIITTGTSLSTLKIFLASTQTDTLITFPYYSENGSEFVGFYQAEPFVPEAVILSDGGNVTNWDHEIAITSDQNYPVNNSNPFSIAVAYSKPGDGGKDTLYFCSSSNGGMSFDNKRIVTLSSHHIEKVALAFGRSLSKPNGRYFVAWDEKNTENAATGHIFTAHSEPYFNSPFTKPVCLDSLDPATINMGRNPSIACQVNNVDNDSTNLTEVVLFDKFNSSTHRYDIGGYYNLQATNHSDFKKLNISNSAHYNIQPSINFNHFDSTFMVTYYDSTTQTLTYLLNDFNLKNPDNWQVISTGYNDSSHLAAPYPKVVLNQDQKKGANVWVSEGIGGNGVAMFDAPYSTWTGVSNNFNETNNLNIYGAYPNPCSRNVTIWFELQKPENTTISIFDNSGSCIIRKSQKSLVGKSFINFDISTLASGCYYYSLVSEGASRMGKIIVIK